MWEKGVKYRASREGWAIFPMTSPTTSLKIERGHRDRMLVCRKDKPTTIYLIEDLCILGGRPKPKSQYLGSTTLVFHEIMEIGQERKIIEGFYRMRATMQDIFVLLESIPQWSPSQREETILEMREAIGLKSASRDNLVESLQEALLTLSPAFQLPDVKTEHKIIMGCQVYKGYLRGLTVWRLEMLLNTTGFIL